MPRNILITGSSGFIGAALVKSFGHRGDDVTAIGRDPIEGAFLTPSAWAKTLNDLRTEVIFHAAGSSSVKASMEDSEADFKNSVGLVRSLFEGVRQSTQRPLIIFMSSAAVYGNPETYPVPETAALRPISPYGYHKVESELIAQGYARCFGITSVSLRIFSLFGPAQKKLLIWELFKKFQSGAGEVEIEGTGQEARDFLSIDDFCGIARSVADRTPIDGRFRAVNVASGTERTVREVAEALRQTLGSNKPLRYLGQNRPGNPLRWSADLGELKKLVGTTDVGLFEKRLKECVDSWRA